MSIYSLLGKPNKYSSNYLNSYKQLKNFNRYKEQLHANQKLTSEPQNPLEKKTSKLLLLTME